MIILFSGVNIGLGLSFLLIALMGYLHKRWGLRFNPQQEHRVIGLIALGALFVGINFLGSGLLGTLQNFANLETTLPALAIIPFVAKVLAGMAWWVVIFWVLFWFYPTQTRKQDSY